MGSSEPSCKCCNGRTSFFAQYDFSRSCEDQKGPVFARAGVLVPYYRCKACGFVFTPYFDGWSKQDFAERIYNSDYVRADPDFAGERPRYLAEQLDLMLAPLRAQLDILDYGGGEGRLIQELKRRGFEKGEVFDPFFSGGARPEKRFKLVIAFEVVEHAVDPGQLFRDALSFLVPDGAVFFTTALQGRKPDPNWWYIAPRNGHISIHSAASLQRLAAADGVKCLSLNGNAHLLYRDGGSAIARQFAGGMRDDTLYAASKRGLRSYRQTANLLGDLGFGPGPKDLRHLARATLTSCGVV